MKPVMTLAALTAISLMTACAKQPVSDGAICAGTLAARQAHADALIESGDERARETGLAVLEKIYAGCA